MPAIVLLRPTTDFTDRTARCTARFQKISGINVEVVSSVSISTIADRIEKGEIAAIFAESPVPVPELNTLTGCFERAKQKPAIIASLGNHEVLKALVPATHLCRAKDSFGDKFIVNCLRHVLMPPSQKIDIRYMKSILNGVLDTIQSNTQLSATASKIEETEETRGSWELTSLIAFSGDGFLGALSIGTTKALMDDFTEKMIGCDRSVITTEMHSDLLGELSSQINGIVRREMSECGFELQSTMQLVVGGTKHDFSLKTAGHYYKMPFRCQDQDFNLTFCYNTMRTPVAELEVETMRSNRGVFDVRLANAAIEAATEILATELGDAVQKLKVTEHLGDNYACSSLHVFHAVGRQGNMIVALDAPEAAASAMLKKASTKQGGTALDANTWFGKIIQRIGDHIIKNALPYGYKLHEVLHGTLVANQAFSYLLKNPGHYVRIEFQVLGQTVTLCFGMQSNYADQLFNAWRYYETQPWFKPKAAGA